jgi:hypothetical protein
MGFGTTSTPYQAIRHCTAAFAPRNKASRPSEQAPTVAEVHPKRAAVASPRHHLKASKTDSTHLYGERVCSGMAPSCPATMPPPLAGEPPEPSILISKL